MAASARSQAGIAPCAIETCGCYLVQLPEDFVSQAGIAPCAIETLVQDRRAILQDTLSQAGIAPCAIETRTEGERTKWRSQVAGRHRAVRD